MKKSKDHIKRFLSFHRPAEERDELLIRLFLAKRKIKMIASQKTPDYENLDILTYEQFEAWYNADMPDVGDVVRSEMESVCLVIGEKWNTFIVGATLTKEGDLSFEERMFTAERWTAASKEDVMSLQKAFSVRGVEWNSISGTLVKRNIPQQPRFVRLMMMGQQVGIGIFKEILPDNTLEMFCVKLDGGSIRYPDSLNLGDADYFSFFNTHERHKAVIQQELGEKGYIWNAKCRRLQKNSAREKAGKNYFWVSSYLEIKQATENDSASDRRHFNSGNYFLKREVALRTRDKIINIYKEEIMSEDNFSAS